MNAQTPWERLDIPGNVMPEFHGGAVQGDDEGGFGSSRETCKQCGARFTLYRSRHVYKRGTGKRMDYLCSYTCMRAYDRAKEERNAGKTGEFVKVWSRTAEGCHKRLALCEEKLSTLADELVSAAVAGDKAKAEYLQNKIYRWKKAQREAEAALWALEG